MTVFKRWSPSGVWRLILFTRTLSPLSPEPVSSLLWNLHTYYLQFSGGIQTKVAKIRAPIEKELKVTPPSSDPLLLSLIGSDSLASPGFS